SLTDRSVYFRGSTEREETMGANRAASAGQLAANLRAPASNPGEAPDPLKILYGTRNPPPFTEGNIFPLEWRVETPKMQQIYDNARDPGWAPNRLPWHTLDPNAFTLD